MRVETFWVRGGGSQPGAKLTTYLLNTSGPYAHDDSFKNLLGERYGALKDSLSLETQVTDAVPPAFV